MFIYNSFVCLLHKFDSLIDYYIHFVFGFGFSLSDNFNFSFGKKCI